MAIIRYSDELFAKICERIAEGESLREICRDKTMPSRTIVFRWLKEKPELVDQYVRAREMQADYYADEIISIADECEDPQKARLQVDARKWKASKMAPKVYGDKVTNEHVGANGMPIETKEVSDIEYARRVAFLLQRASRAGAGKAEGGDA